jgi:hypothetical protein
LEQELGKEYLSEVMVTPNSATVGRTLDQLEWAKRQDATIVGVIREGERMPPNGWMKLHAGDALIVQGAVPTIGSLLKSPDFHFLEEVKIGEKALRSLTTSCCYGKNGRLAKWIRKGKRSRLFRADAR